MESIDSDHNIDKGNYDKVVRCLKRMFIVKMMVIFDSLVCSLSIIIIYMQKQVEEYSEEREQQEQYPHQEKIQEKDEENCSKRLNGISIFCLLCNNYLAHSVTTTCEHTFCELCLAEYLLYLDECPECCTKIRNQKQANNILLDNLILDYIKKFEPQELQQYEKRLQQYKDYKRKRTIGELETGMLVDVRDLDYVWCTGRVHRTINKFHDRKVKYAIIKYDRSTKKEQIVETSPRLAPRGFFTEREDIPKYERGKLILKSPEEGVCYHLVPEQEEQQEAQIPQGEM